MGSVTGPSRVDFHNRQPVILPKDGWSEWLDVKNDFAPSFRGSPAGTIAEEICPLVKAEPPRLLL
jgi:hypothetical protein